MIEDPVNALVPGISLRVEGAGSGPLAGLTFAAKDLFDVAGYVTGGGNPDWSSHRSLPGRNAWVVQALLDSGATLVGKTITDEISLGILGENVFYGTPTNTAAQGRVPGGSSSGSAATVAAAMCDFAIGTDTGGSVRVPASFCGLYGIRPTHGRLDLTGMLPQAPSSDTAGWFARDAGTFSQVAEVLLQEPIPIELPQHLLIAADAFGFAHENVRTALGPMVERLRRVIGSTEEVTMAPQGLSVWARAQRTLQPHEAWLTFREWLDKTNPRMAYSVARNIYRASTISPSERDCAALMRKEASARLDHLLPPGTILCLPTTPFPAPLKGLPISETDPLRSEISCLCSHGGLTGVPQVSLPGATVEDLPVGLSIVGRRGSDASLIATARGMEDRQS